MVKEGLMKKLLVLSLVFACMTGNAQVSADSVVMTVAGKQIPLDDLGKNHLPCKHAVRGRLRYTGGSHSHADTHPRLY